MNFHVTLNVHVVGFFVLYNWSSFNFLTSSISSFTSWFVATKMIANHAFMVHTFPLLTFPGGLEAVEDVYSLDVIGQRSVGEQGAVPVDCVQGKFKG